LEDVYIENDCVCVSDYITRDNAKTTICVVNRVRPRSVT
jgi:hypothetical protein